jgi:DNA-binding CsgD family transcriptional regulator
VLGAQLVLDLGLCPAANGDPVPAAIWLPADRDRPGPAVPAPVVVDRILASGAALGLCQLASAYQIFDSIGAAAFAERARIELRAAGGQPRQHTVETPDTLTAQEALIARLAGRGASNPEIAAQLFISRATVAYHLRKVFVTLGITSRDQLARVLPVRPDTTVPVASPR